MPFTYKKNSPNFLCCSIWGMCGDLATKADCSSFIRSSFGSPGCFSIKWLLSFFWSLEVQPGTGQIFFFRYFSRLYLYKRLSSTKAHRYDFMCVCTLPLGATSASRANNKFVPHLAVGLCEKIEGYVCMCVFKLDLLLYFSVLHRPLYMALLATLIMCCTDPGMK